MRITKDKKGKMLFVIIFFMALCLGINIPMEGKATGGTVSVHTGGKNVSVNQTTVHFSKVNPVYANAKIELEGDANSSDKAKQYNSSVKVFTQDIDALNYMKTEMLNRVTTIKFDITRDSLSDYTIWGLDSYMDRIFEMGSSSVEREYLRFNVYNCSGKIETDMDEINYKTTYHVSYNITYFTTKAQEDALNSKISEVRKTIFTSTMTDYQKVKAAYDYITSNVKYDYAGLEDTTDMLKYTAYGALMENSAVCQGYATLFYRLLQEEGIETHMVTSDKMKHVWNIVKLNNLFYYVDATWGGNAYEDIGALSYIYFLKGSKDFSEHEADDTQYNDAVYPEFYPLALNTYNVANPEKKQEEKGIVAKGKCGSKVFWKLNSEGTIYLIGTGDTWDCSNKMYTDEYYELPWKNYKNAIKKVVVEEGVTKVGGAFFQNCKNLTSISLADSVENIEYVAFADCPQLKDIKLPKKLHSMGCECFARTGINEVNLPGQITYYGPSLFAECPNLEKIYIDWDEGFVWSSIMYENSEIANGSKKLKRIDVSPKHPSFVSIDGVRYGTDAGKIVSIIDYPCGRTESFYEIKDGVQIITPFTFHDAVNLKEVKIPNSVIEISSLAFESSGLEKVEFVAGSKLKMIAESAFAYTKLKNITLPDSLEEIKDYAFVGLKNIEWIVFGTGLKKLGMDILVSSPGMPGMDAEYFAKLTGVFYKGSKEQLMRVSGYQQLLSFPMHYNTTTHSYISIGLKPATVSASGMTAGSKCSVCGHFANGCKKIEKIGKIYLSNKNVLIIEDVKGNKISSSYYSVKSKKNKKKKKTTYAITFKGNYSGTVTKTFKDGSFEFVVSGVNYKVTSKSEVTLVGLTMKKNSLVIPKKVKFDGKTYKVTSIGKNAFKNKTMKMLTIGANVKSIGANAFYGSKILVKMIIKSTGLNKIGKNAFKKVKKKIKLIVPKKKKAAYKKLFSKYKVVIS